MTSVRHLPAEARIARAWRNGGGVTYDVALFPEGAGDEDFLWRASIATIAADGPFSPWPGVDRALMLLHGKLTLAVGDDERDLEAGDPAQAFAGEEAVSARPCGGACIVLNLMARRGDARIMLERWTTGRLSKADQLLLLAESATTIGLNGQSINLAAEDALLLTPKEVTGLTFDHPVIVAEIFSGAEQFAQI